MVRFSIAISVLLLVCVSKMKMYHFNEHVTPSPRIISMFSSTNCFLSLQGARGDSSQSNTTLGTVVSYMKDAQAELDDMMKSLTEGAKNVTSWVNSTVQNQLGQVIMKSFISCYIPIPIQENS